MNISFLERFTFLLLWHSPNKVIGGFGAFCHPFKESNFADLDKSAPAERWKAGCVYPVSYTHLDVYKRQAGGRYFFLHQNPCNAGGSTPVYSKVKNLSLIHI